MKKFLSIALFMLVSLAIVRADDATNAVPTLPPLPIKVTFRKAVLGSGYVLTITSKADDTLSLKVTLTNPTFAKQKIYDLHIDSKTVKEIGHLQGWSFASGDTAEFYSIGYAEKKLIFNPEQ
ncbi:MAG TPA: hypothetical protein VHY30_05770 [Verrucomicrobiae bacterium]|jgi:hypothetical protein|nr:hypothetical protein [Verrucomicrobiae bacterium]